MTRNRCALITIFNHKFERNIPLLDRYYADRFPTRKYIVPFTDSARDDVIGVYANGWSFGHHIAQAADRYISPEINYYIFAADDLILSPKLDEASLVDAFGIPPTAGYIKSIAVADTLRYAFTWTGHGTFSLRFAGFDWRSELPPAEAVWPKIEALGLRTARARPRGLHDLAWWPRKASRSRFLFLLNLLMTGRNSAYPLLVGYSDFVIVPAAAVRRFARYCGVLSAANMQAELVVPTALLLSCDAVETELPAGHFFLDGTPNSPKLSRADAAERTERQASRGGLTGLELWGDDIAAFEKRYNNDFGALVHSFPEGRGYVHPIKLSRWKASAVSDAALADVQA